MAAHVEAAPFTEKVIKVSEKYRMTYRDQVVRGRSDSLTFHLIKRVMHDQQWSAGTTLEEFLQDVHSAARSPSAKLAVYEDDWRGAVVAVFAPTADVVPASRRGPNALPWLFVLYSAESGTIVTAYMCSSLDAVRKPENVQWLM